MANNKNPDLHFSPCGIREGFTSAGVQGFSELNPAAIVRELIQNSLDAVREDGRTQAIIRFELEKMKLDAVPAIDSYRVAVESAIRDQKKLFKGELPDQAVMVVDAIQDCLNAGSIEVLSVLDNGSGLNKARMAGLLADGLSVKSSDGTGAMGNGHLTAIPASNLRYILYGGVSDEGRIASGHAILASFSNPQDKSVGKDGYYILAVNSSMEKPYDFICGDDIAPLIKKKLDRIENLPSKKGAAVIILGFNRFREAEIDLWDTIKKAVACSFFTAIADGHLEIVYTDGGSEKKLNKSNMSHIFADDLVTEKRAKNFLSGNRAAEAYKTATEGKVYCVDVECGHVELIIREVPAGPSRIDLCRNGMWITNNLPRLQRGKFSNRKPFHCLIKMTAQDGEFHKLIRKSEGPLHNHIEAKKWLKEAELTKLNRAFSIISEFLLDNLEELQSEEFKSNFLTVMSEKGVLSGGRRAGRLGKFEEVPPPRVRSPSIIGGEAGGGGVNSGGSGGGITGNAFKRTGNSISFGAIPVPTGLRSYTFELLPQEDLKGDIEAEIRFVLDENIDETCDITNHEQFVKLKRVKLNNRQVPTGSLIKSKSAVLGVRLGHFKKGEKHILSFSYDLPDGVDVQVKDKVALRAEIVRRKATA